MEASNLKQCEEDLLQHLIKHEEAGIAPATQGRLIKVEQDLKAAEQKIYDLELWASKTANWREDHTAWHKTNTERITAKVKAYDAYRTSVKEIDKDD